MYVLSSITLEMDTKLHEDLTQEDMSVCPQFSLDLSSIRQTALRCWVEGLAPCKRTLSRV